MSKKFRFDDDEEYNERRHNTQPRRKDKKIKNALRTKNIDDLIDMDDDE